MMDENVDVVSAPAPTFPGTLRDWFAGMALQGLVSQRAGHFNTEDERLIYYARLSGRYADAMIAAREARP